MDVLDPNRLLQFISCLSYKYYESFPTIFMGATLTSSKRLWVLPDTAYLYTPYVYVCEWREIYTTIISNKCL